jgi:hypothetical protein
MSIEDLDIPDLEPTCGTAKFKLKNYLNKFNTFNENPSWIYLCPDYKKFLLPKCFSENDINYYLFDYYIGSSCVIMHEKSNNHVNIFYINKSSGIREGEPFGYYHSQNKLSYLILENFIDPFKV